MRMPACLNDLLSKRADTGPIILDGGLATQCEAMGYDISGHLWSAGLLRNDPDAVQQAHTAYLRAGADILISASYQVSRSGFRREGLSDEDADRALTASIDVARAARDAYAATHPQHSTALVAASVGPFGATLHDGSEYTGVYTVDAGQLRDFHRERLQILDVSGADLLACETIPSVTEARVLQQLLRSTRTPAWVSFCCRDGERISDGTCIEAVAELYAEHPGVFAIGVNCTAPAHVQSLVERMRRVAPELAIVVYPNSGESWEAQSNRWNGSASPQRFVTQAQSWLEAGASIIGGCCRVGPTEIAALGNLVPAVR
jgi:homocysteine S-methyltransferase